MRGPRFIRRAGSLPFTLYRSWRLPKLPKRESNPQFKETIFAIGDSHVSLFTGRDVIQPVWPKPGFDILPQFRCFNIGPGLAFNLCCSGTTSLSRERFWAALSFVPQECMILVSFGEIDCRAHLLRHGGSIEAKVEKCADRYFKSLEEVLAAGYRMLVYNAPPSNPSDSLDPAYPSVGSGVERNKVIMSFNDAVRKRCEARHVPFISTTPMFINEQGLTERGWMMDGVHLSQKALPLTLKAISAHVPGLSAPIA
jgi:hypothetical protein